MAMVLTSCQHMHVHVHVQLLLLRLGHRSPSLSVHAIYVCVDCFGEFSLRAKNKQRSALTGCACSRDCSIRSQRLAL